ncbi:hypothetical protein EXW96_20860 [Paenibacillus sp. JMULE4]|uniref:hypothetical protein n=1 Tax=Paenibacillus sp. JMULE4 TaxID=2518342 RepID=UPI001574F500|nr:hypothetical protein [Paenibacillus sp. JMULE4]NTZ19908.1 hypothetical protein [Paenibacillus sp. JMULE4]
MEQQALSREELVRAGFRAYYEQNRERIKANRRRYYQRQKERLQKEVSEVARSMREAESKHREENLP